MLQLDGFTRCCIIIHVVPPTQIISVTTSALVRPATEAILIINYIVIKESSIKIVHPPSHINRYNPLHQTNRGQNASAR